jgi:hypothetical protein
MLRYLAALTVTCLFLFTTAHAQSVDNSTRIKPDKPLSFWVYFDRTKSDWDIGDQEKVDTEVDRIGFGFAQKFNNRVKGGLFLGFSGLSQQDNPAGEIDQSGGHIGLLIQGLPYKGERFMIDTGGSIAYNLVNGDQDAQEVETSWVEGLAYAKGIITLHPVMLTIGGNYQYISGSEKFKGTPLNQSNDINASDDLSALAGIDIMVGGGTIGFHGEWGARNKFALVFARDF